MDIRDFFARVVAWDGEGVCSVHTKGPEKADRLSGQVFSTLDTFMGGVKLLQQSTVRVNVWFCLARHTGQRTRKNARAFRSVFGDLDVDPDDPKKYPDIATAISAVFRFCQTVGIPLPSAVVVTGGGIHVYWFADRDLTVSEWQPFAEGLKILFRNHGIKADLGVTADAARILRVPGTLNPKHDPSRRVVILPNFSPGTQYDFSTDLEKLLEARPIGKLGKSAKAFDGKLDPSEGLGDGMERTAPPVNFDRVKEHCPWLRECHETGGATDPEPLWHAAARICTHLTEGETLIHELSRGHDGYDYEDTEAKFERASNDQYEKNLGWPQCEHIQSSGCTHCKDCPHLEAGKSPLNLGLPTREERLDQAAEKRGLEKPDDLQLPEGFYADPTTGHVKAVIVDKKGIDYDLPVFNTRIANPRLIHLNGQYGLAFDAGTELGVTSQVFVPAVDAYSGRAAGKLASQCVFVPNVKPSLDRLNVLTPSWIDKLRNFKPVEHDPGTLGWRFEDGKRTGFVYAGKLYSTNGMTSSVPLPVDSLFHKWYLPTGKKEPWLKAAKLLTDRKRPELDIIICVGLAAPLMTFAGNIYGGILSVWGEPGTSKSCAQQVAAAMWGHPKLTRESLNSTPKSVQNRLGQIKNLAAYWDDIQSVDHQGFLNNTMFVSTQGAEGSRLNPDATQKERKEWHTLLIACSNVSFVGYLIDVEKNTTAGIRRVLEFQFDKIPDKTGLVDGLEANQTFAALEYNYGLIGQEFVQYLVENHEAVERLVTAMIKRFKDKVGGEADESYWWSICGVLIAAGALARELGIEIDLQGMEVFLANVFEENRATRKKGGTEGGSLVNTERALTDFLNHHKDTEQLVYTDVAFTNRHSPVKLVKDTYKGRVIIGHVVRDERRIIISKSALRDYLAEKKLNTRRITDGIFRFFNAKEIRFSIGGGTSFTQASQPCLDIPVPPNSEFNTILTAYGPVQNTVLKLIR